MIRTFMDCPDRKPSKDPTFGSEFPICGLCENPEDYVYCLGALHHNACPRGYANPLPPDGIPL